MTYSPQHRFEATMAEIPSPQAHDLSMYIGSFYLLKIQSLRDLCYSNALKWQTVRCTTCDVDFLLRWGCTKEGQLSLAVFAIRMAIRTCRTLASFN